MNWIHLAKHRAGWQAAKNLTGWEYVSLWRRIQKQEFSYQFLYSFIWRRSVEVILPKSLVIIKKLHLECYSWLLYRNRQMQHASSTVFVCLLLIIWTSLLIFTFLQNTIDLTVLTMCAMCTIYRKQERPQAEGQVSIFSYKAWRAKVCRCAGVWGTFNGHKATVVLRAVNNGYGPGWEIIYHVRWAGCSHTAGSALAFGEWFCICVNKWQNEYSKISTSA
jgi:hypothetical protein